MLIPYSTDAPIYHFPWMTIGLIVVNSITFVITGMGLHSQGWLLTYGNGLHPLEWLAYNFLHFGAVHLVGNMFFLWAFGIVVEGKLGWWKFLGVYLSIGVLGGMLIQIAMLGYGGGSYVHREPYRPVPWRDNQLYAQDFRPDINDIDMDDDEPEMPRGKEPRAGDQPAAPGVGRGNAKADGKEADDLEIDGEVIEDVRPGAGGASLIIYGLMSIVLIWAPRNEIHCLLIGIRSGTLEIEYLYFCGFYIVTEVLSAAFSSRGFEVSSEVGHATGAMVGFGLGTLFVKKDWVDCENWDLFAIMKGTHGATASVGEWQNNFVLGLAEKRESAANKESDEAERRVAANRKKRKAKPKLVELESFEDSMNFESDEVLTVEPWEEDTKTYRSPAAESQAPAPLPPIPARRSEGRSNSKPLSGTSRRPRSGDGQKSTSSRFRQLLIDRQFEEAQIEYLDQRSQNSDFQLPQDELRMLANGLFKAQVATEAAELFEEYIERYPDDADRPRIKLAVLNVKFFQRPTYALKTLAKVNTNSLAPDYLEIYRKTARYAQQMIADGMVDIET